jgi:hypothetical protein
MELPQQVRSQMEFGNEGKHSTNDLGNENGSANFMGMRFFDALACLFGASFIGQIFMTFGLDPHGWAWHPSSTLLYVFIVACSTPFWLFTFLPLYILSNFTSPFWRWYVAPPSGALVGLISALVLFAPTQYDFYDFPRQNMAPLVIGFATFLFGTILNPSRMKKST